MEDSFKIYTWMAVDLLLSGNELLIYALIYDICKREGSYKGGIRKVSFCLGLSNVTCSTILKRLVNKGLLKIEVARGKGAKDTYYINFDEIANIEAKTHFNGHG